MSHRIATILIVCTFCWVSLSRRSKAEWDHVTAPAEREALIALAKSSLESHWHATRKGWCRALVENQTREVRIAWDENGVSVVSQLMPENGDGNPDFIGAYTPKEQWIFTKISQGLHGSGGRNSQKLRPTWDCRPHSIWLSQRGGGSSNLTHLAFLSRILPHNPVIQRSTDNHVRFCTPSSMVEFNVDAGFSPIQLDFQTTPSGLADPSQAAPLREVYAIARDLQGVWYCKETIRTTWKKSTDEDPQVRQVMKVLEYESQPTREHLVLDYKSMPLPVGTRVQSSVPGHSGTWLYGKETDNVSAVDEALLRSLGESAKNRGYSAATRDQSP